MRVRALGHRGNDARQRPHGQARMLKPMLFAGSQNNVVRKNYSHSALGRVFRRLIRVVTPPRRDPGPITFDRREAARFRRLKGREDIWRSFVRIESGVVHDLPQASL